MKIILKKTIYILLCLIFSLLASFSIFFYHFSKETNKFTIENLSGKNYIDRIGIGSTLLDNSTFGSIRKIDEKKYIVLSNKKELSFKISKTQNLFIHFDSKKSSGKVRVIFNNKVKIIDIRNCDNYMYSANLKNILINSFTSKINLILFILISLLIFFTYYYLIKIIYTYINCIIMNKKKWYYFPIIYFSYFLFFIFSLLPLVNFWGKYFSLVIFAQLIAVLLMFKKYKKWDYKNVFLLIATICTINMSILLPPFHVPDEVAHFMKAYSIANPSLSKVDNGKHYVLLPNNTNDNIGKYTAALQSTQYRTTIKEYYVDFTEMSNSNYTKRYYFDNTYGINSFCYLIPSFIIFIFSLFHLPIILCSIVCRIVNAFVFILFGYEALKIAPKFKRILFIILLLPITIQEVCAVNQDTITISIAILLISYYLKLIYDDTISEYSTKNILLFIFISFLLGLCKPIYFPITFLSLLLPKKKFKNKLTRVAAITLPFVFCILGSSYQYLGMASDKSFVDKKMFSLSYGINHPKAMLDLVLSTLDIRYFNDILYLQLNNFGWLTTSYINFFATLIGLMYFLILFSNSSENISKKHHIFFVILGFMSLLLVYVASISFNLTPIGDVIIEGIQARYLIPVLSLIYIGFSNNVIELNFKNNNYFVYIVIAFTMFIVFNTILNCFYSNTIYLYY